MFLQFLANFCFFSPFFFIACSVFCTFSTTQGPSFLSKSFLTPLAYRSVRTCFAIISKTCLFNRFFALTIFTLLLMTAAMTGIVFEVHATKKQCSRAAKSKLIIKETFWVQFAVLMCLHGFFLWATAKTSKENFIPCYWCPVRAYQVPNACCPESALSNHYLITHCRFEELHYYQHSEKHPLHRILDNANTTIYIFSTGRCLFFQSNVNSGAFIF